jgi:DNA-binding transcriptional LysR family regulator
MHERREIVVFRRRLMRNRMDRLDWNQLRAFLETAERGSLSAAARRLGLTQPTLSRQVAAIEASLGVTLFERVGKSMVLTTAGLGLLEHARTMGSAAEELALAATGRAEGVEGLVAISASDAVAAFLLPSAIRRIREVAPKVVVEIVTSNALSDLRRREADIAIRHVSPTEPDLIARHLREATASFYASKAWVAAHGHPRTAQDALAHDFIGADRAGRFLDYLRAHGLPLTTAHFPVHSESSVSGWALVREGLGIGVMMDDVARQTPDVVRVLDDVAPVRFPIWLVTHRELRTARRIRVVFDVLVEHFGRD